GQAAQYFGQAARIFARLDERSHHRREGVGIVRHRAGECLAALDRFDETGNDFAKTRVIEAVAQIGQSFDHRHARSRELFELKAEIDQIDTLHAAAAVAAAFGRTAHHKIETHALEAQFEIDDVQ